LSWRDVGKHGQCLIGNNFNTYQDRMTNNVIFFSLKISVQRHMPQQSDIAANKKIEQENKHFLEKSYFFKIWPSIGGGRQ